MELRRALDRVGRPFVLLLTLPPLAPLVGAVLLARVRGVTVALAEVRATRVPGSAALVAGAVALTASWAAWLDGGSWGAVAAVATAAGVALYATACAAWACAVGAVDAAEEWRRAGREVARAVALAGVAAALVMLLDQGRPQVVAAALVAVGAAALVASVLAVDRLGRAAHSVRVAHDERATSKVVGP